MDKIVKILILIGVILICSFVGYYFLIEIPRMREHDSNVLKELNDISKSLKYINASLDK